ncbi:DUF305 domain-containing protein [[Actinomadura] parvosata]|uniref:DUF305 domain-containing protein n=1 Tax=[Actinomadura] parvosata TaxID=1955412 RepID=UPI00406CE500
MAKVLPPFFGCGTVPSSTAADRARRHVRGGHDRAQGGQGAEFDKLFARHMIAHHDGAIEMARTEQSSGSSPEAKELAKTIETARRAEVERLRKILDRL